jgi:hypothetical protein
MNATSAPLARGQSEFAYAGLEAEPSRHVRPPRVKGVPAAPLKAPPGLLQSGSYALYAEMANGGWIERISEDTGVTRAKPPDPTADATDGAASAPAKTLAGMPNAVGADAPASHLSGRAPGVDAAPPAAAASGP